MTIYFHPKFAHVDFSSVQFSKCLLLHVCVDCDVQVMWHCILCTIERTA